MNIKPSATEQLDRFVTQDSMLINRSSQYAAPEISIIAIEVELGVAASTDPWDQEEL